MIKAPYDGNYQNNGFEQHSVNLKKDSYTQNSGSYRNNGFKQNRVNLKKNSYGKNNGYSPYTISDKAENGFEKKLNKNNDRYDVYYKIGRFLIIALAIYRLVFQAVHIFPKCYGFSSPTAAVLTLLFFSIIPLCLTLNGWHIFVLGEQAAKSRRNNCTQTVDAKIINFKEVVSSNENGTSTAYYAIYEFSFNGNKYQAASKDAYNRERYEKIRCRLMINPNDPNEIYELENEIEDLKFSRKLGLKLLLIGFGLMSILKFY